MRELGSLRRPHSDSSDSKTVMRSPSLHQQTLASDLILAIWVLLVQGSEEAKGRSRRIWRYLFNDSLCSGFFVILLSFMSSKVTPFLTWSPSPRIYSLGKEEVSGDMGYCHDIPAQSEFSPALLSFFHWDEKSLYMLIQMGGGEHSVQDTVRCWPGWIYTLRCIGPSFQNAEFVS